MPVRSWTLLIPEIQLVRRMSSVPTRYQLCSFAVQQILIMFFFLSVFALRRSRISGRGS